MHHHLPAPPHFLSQFALCCSNQIWGEVGGDDLLGGLVVMIFWDGVGSDDLLEWVGGDDLWDGVGGDDLWGGVVMIFWDEVGGDDLEGG